MVGVISALRFLIAAAFFADADLPAAVRDAAALPPFFPPLWAAGCSVSCPRPGPPGFLPPPFEVEMLLATG